MATQDSRIKIKRSTVGGIAPTVPSSDDHTDGTWVATDIYKGELYYNQADNILYTRDDTGIVVISTPTYSTAPYKTTTNISASGSGTTLTIPTASYAGDVSTVTVWDGDILLRPTIVKGLSGSDKTVTIITNKAYTNARVTVTFE